MPDIETLSKELIALEKQGESLSEFGLIAQLDFAEFKKAITNIEPKKVRALRSVLHLFIDTTKARLNALQGLYDTINDLIGSVNSFFTNKYLTFDLTSGIKIYHNSGETIDFSFLSSGEKQLLLLFINTITATDQATIFIIDEPEISLNIKWQRKLLNSLLRLSTKSQVQFMIATHSIELLAPNVENVVKLEDQE